MKRPRGFALLVVLWTLALTTLVETQLVATGRRESRRAGNLRDAAALEATADGVVQQAIFALLDRSAAHWRADGTLHRLRLGQSVAEVRIENEAGKLNPNSASEPLLRALFVRAGADPRVAAGLAAAILDWRTGASAPRPFGAKAPQYAAAGLDYGPPGAPFRTMDELGSVLGMTPALLARLRPHLTVFTDADPDATTTDPLVAAALADAGEAVPVRAAGELEWVEVARITVVVQGSGGGSFGEHVVVRTYGRTDGRPYEILLRDRSGSP